MRLSIGVFLTALYECQHSSRKTWIPLIEALVSAVDPINIYETKDESGRNITPYISDLKKCKTNVAMLKQPLPPPVINKFRDIRAVAQTADLSEMSARFTKDVVHLLSLGMIDSLIAFFKHLIKMDDEINDTNFAALVGSSKVKFDNRDYSGESLGEFLAGLFRFSFLEVENRKGRGCESPDCLVILVNKNPGIRRDKKQELRAEYTKELNSAIASCNKDCVLRITEKYIRQFAPKQSIAEITVSKDGEPVQVQDFSVGFDRELKETKTVPAKVIPASVSSQSPIAVLEAEIDSMYSILAPDSHNESPNTYTDSYVTIAIKLRNDGSQTMLINKMVIKVDEYITNEKPHFKYSVDVVDGNLEIYALNNGWGDATNASFLVELRDSNGAEIRFINRKSATKSTPSIATTERAKIFTVKTSDLCLEHSSVVENISAYVKASIGEIFLEDTKAKIMERSLDSNMAIRLRSFKDCKRLICIEDSVFKIKNIYNDYEFGCELNPSSFYGSVINSPEERSYKISRAIPSNAIDAFNLYIGSHKAITIKFRVIFAHNNTALAQTEQITADIISYTDSKSYNDVIDGQRIKLENFLENTLFGNGLLVK